MIEPKLLGPAGMVMVGGMTCGKWGWSSTLVVDEVGAGIGMGSIELVKVEGATLELLPMGQPSGKYDGILLAQCYVNCGSNNWCFRANLSLGVLPVWDRDLAHMGNMQKPDSLATLS